MNHSRLLALLRSLGHLQSLNDKMGARCAVIRRQPHLKLGLCRYSTFTRTKRRWIISLLVPEASAVNKDISFLSILQRLHAAPFLLLVMSFSASFFNAALLNLNCTGGNEFGFGNDKMISMGYTKEVMQALNVVFFFSKCVLFQSRHASLCFVLCRTLDILILSTANAVLM